MNPVNPLWQKYFEAAMLKCETEMMKLQKTWQPKQEQPKEQQAQPPKQNEQVNYGA